MYGYFRFIYPHLHQINCCYLINRDNRMDSKTLIILCSFIHGFLCEVDDTTLSKELTTSQAWGYGYLSSVCLIILGLLGQEIVMIVKHLVSINSFRIFLNMLYALACGTMVGDVILHSLPQAFTSQDTKVPIVGLLFMLSIFAFIVMDRIFKYCGLSAQRWGTTYEVPPIDPEHPNQRLNAEGSGGQNKDGKDNFGSVQPKTLKDHWQSFLMPQKRLREELREIRKRQTAQKIRIYEEQVNRFGIFETEQQFEDPNQKIILQSGNDIHRKEIVTKQKLNHNQNANETDKNKKRSEDIEPVRSFTTYQRRSDLKRSTALLEEARKRDEELDKEKNKENEDCIDRLKGKRAEGYLEIFMSFVHNFFDGFAIGVGFGTRDSNEYIPILVAVYTHAIPRELGDIAILMKAGFDDCQTKVCSGFPKITILVGCAVGLGLQTTSDAAKEYIVTIVAGTFMYLAADIWKSLFLSNQKLKNICQLLILIIGVAIEYLLLLVEH